MIQEIAPHVINQHLIMIKAAGVKLRKIEQVSLVAFAKS
jgi:hypothetical protein